MRTFNQLLLCFFVIVFFSCNKTNEPEVPTEQNYISTVFEYVYAPGQHAPIAKATDIDFFIGPIDDNGWLHLGGFGGYVIAGFSRNVENKDGYDFEIFSLPGASPEPAIVYVMEDENGNGLPDDENWYELKGNQFEAAQRNYWVTYHKPSSDNENITWIDANGDSGELISTFGTSSSAGWWWSSTESVTFSGTRLPDAYELNNEGTWIVPKDMFTYGYAENIYGTDYDKNIGSNKLDISNAIDADGNEVDLTHIRFIKVQTAIFQQVNRLNEISAEVRGAREIK